MGINRCLTPTTPRPFPPGFKPNKKEIEKHIIDSIDFYNEKLEKLLSNSPFIFKKKWNKDVITLKNKISDLEYKLLAHTQPKIIKEVEKITRNK